MTRSILWIDDDPFWIDPFVAKLREGGYSVEVATSALSGERAITAKRFDLIILDVMIPTVDMEEEYIYTPSATDHGFRTGLVLFRRVRERLVEQRTAVLVLTVRIDSAIRQEFFSAGLPELSFANKGELRRIENFVERVSILINEALA